MQIKIWVYISNSYIVNTTNNIKQKVLTIVIIDYSMDK